jgi:hypothetical protein
VSTVVRDLERARTAYDKPTLRLLNQRDAPFILAVFSTLLPAEQTRMAAELFHVKVDTCLQLLRAHDPAAPADTAPALCREWVRKQWLWRTSNEAGGEEYGLTSHAREALEYIGQLSGQRAVFGEGRIRTILEAAQRCATLANPDPTERIRRLEQQIADATAELERIRGGGEIEQATDDQILDAYLNLSQLLAALPADFARVSEAVKTIHRRVVADLRSEARSPGEVLDDYLQRADNLMTASLEGRAFKGAVELLRDERLLTELRGDLIAIGEHEFTQTLTAAEREALRQTVTGIRRGIDTVLAERRRLSSSLARHIRRYDVVRDLELDDVLQAIERELPTWMAATGPRAKLPLQLDVQRSDIGHLRERMYDPVDHAPPAPLAAHQVIQEQDLLTLAREQGGPDLPRLRERLHALTGTARTTAADLFNAFPLILRRPVEVVGLVHAIADTDLMHVESGSEQERYLTRRPDGTRRAFTGPALTLQPSDDPAPDPTPSKTDRERTGTTS